MTLYDWSLVYWYAKGVALVLMYLSEPLLVNAPPAFQSAFLWVMDVSQLVL